MEPRIAVPVGAKLGPYEVVSLIGVGGMGEVYQARDTRLNRKVAIKVLPAHLAARTEARERFEREARAISSLNHPYICSLYDVGRQDGLDFLVMEYLDGETLANRLRKGALQPDEALRYGVQILNALDRAHRSGVVHRDLKPANVMLTRDGAKLLDFGLAKLRETTTPEQTVTMALTTEGTIVGTFQYMAPEQLEARDADERTDIFAFGAVLYEMLTGRKAFAGKSQASLISSIMTTTPPPVSSVQPMTTPALDRLVRQCLEKDPEERWQSAHDLGRELKWIAEGGSRAEVPVPPAARRKGRGWLGLLGAMVGCALLGASGMWWFRVRDSPVSDSGYFLRPLTTYSGIEQYPALSPDGKQIAFTWNGENKDNDDIYVRQVAGGPALRLTTDTGRDIAPTWSPDGETVAFIHVSGGAAALYSVRALGGVEHKLFEFPQGNFESSAFTRSRISWSPDGRLLAFACAPVGEATQIWILPLDTRESRRISTPPKGWYGDVQPAFSPDGRTLAYVRGRDLWSRAIVFQPIGRDGAPAGPAREMTDYTRSIFNLAWLPDGRSLVTALGADVWPTISRFTPGKGFAALGLYSGVDPSVALKGKRMAYTISASERNVYRMDGPGPNGGPRPLERCHVSAVIDSTVSQTDIMLSSDGSRLAFISPRTGYREVYVANADGSNQEALTSMGPTSLGSPRWSPDGHWIAFDRYEDGHSVIYAIRAEGGEPRRMTNPQGSDTRPSWSRDGKWIYFSSNRGGRYGIWKLSWPIAEPNAGSVAEVPVKSVGSVAAMFEGPDGKQLFYSNAGGIWSVPTGGGDSQLIVPGVYTSQWALAGHSLYFVRRRGAEQSLWVHRLETGQQFEYVRFPTDRALDTPGTTLTVSQDEKSICFVRVDGFKSDLMLVENFH